MRGLAILAVSALFCQHALELAHALTVEHVRCAEHGELLDVTQSTGEPVAAGLSRSPPAAERGHDHCTVDWLAHFEAGTPPPAFEPTLFATHTASALPERTVQSSSPLAFAPKTSPPCA